MLIKVWQCMGWSLQILCLILAFTVMWGCATARVDEEKDKVIVAPIGTDQAEASTTIKRQELQQEIMRFADRYAARMQLEADRIRETAGTAEGRWFALGWAMASQQAVVDIAIGSNAVENLLDMMVLASLTRQEVESYWAPEYFGEEQGEGLLRASRDLEEDIWTISERVLTPEQQDDLRAMIREWNEQRPDQHYFWFVRFSGFSGQRAAQLEGITETGGLLGEVSETRKAVDEVRDFGERTLYYLQRAPAMTTMEAQFAVYDILRQPEIKGLLDDSTRFTQSVERFADLAEGLPQERLAAIDQLMEQLEQQRKDFLEESISEEARLRGMLGEVQQTFIAGNDLAQNVNSTANTVERIIEKLDLGAADKDKESKPFDINEYRQLLTEASGTVNELKLLMESVDHALDSPLLERDIPQALQVVDHVDEDLAGIVNRMFILGVLLILVFFAALLAYRYISARLPGPGV
jgi:hypothetical protein